MKSRPLFILSKIAFCVYIGLVIVNGCSKPPRPTISVYDAAREGDVDQIKRHVYWGCDLNEGNPNRDDSDYGYTPLMSAVKSRQVAAINYLLSLQNVDINKSNNSLRSGFEGTALHVAVWNWRVALDPMWFGPKDNYEKVKPQLDECIAIIELLLRNGGGQSRSAKMNDGDTPWDVVEPLLIVECLAKSPWISQSSIEQIWQNIKYIEKLVALNDSETSYIEAIMRRKSAK